MRIAIVAGNQDVVGGVESYLSWVLRALVARGHELAFAFEQASLEPERALDRGVEQLRRWDLRAVERSAFFEQLTRFSPDIVFLQGCRDGTLDLQLAQRFRTVLFAHVFYGACATGFRVHDFPGRQICTRHFGPACLAVNYLRGCGARNPLGLVQLYAGQRERSKVLPRLAGVIVASRYMREVFLQHGLRGDRVHVIPLPAESPRAPSAPTVRASPSKVLFLGRLTVAKGGARAVEVVARCQRALGRPLHLTFAGEGPELARCRQLALELGVATDFEGWVGPERRAALLCEADVLIVPSLWPEPFGMVGIEAASVGLPTVAYRVGGIVDWLRPGESGELADGAQFSTEGLADALARALCDANHYRRLQLGAWHVAQEFNAEQHLDRLERIFRELSLRAA